MKAGIGLKVWGVRGGAPSWKNNEGCVTAFVDNGDDYVSVDAFEGHGETYKRRNESVIEISYNGSKWKGSLKELAEKLF